jgi:hypothetical protein
MAINYRQSECSAGMENESTVEAHQWMDLLDNLPELSFMHFFVYLYSTMIMLELGRVKKVHAGYLIYIHAQPHV